MTTILRHIPEDPADAIRFCAVNSRDYPHLTKEAGKRLNELQKNWPHQLETLINEKLDNWTLLHYAVEHNNPALCKALLAHGADPRVKDRAGMQPLHVAARHGYKKCIQVLLTSEADPLARDNQGRRPCQVAWEHYKKDVVAILKMAETRDENMAPAVVENQITIERIARELEAMRQRQNQPKEATETTAAATVTSASQPQRQRYNSEVQCENKVLALLSRVAQLEHSCAANAQEIFGCHQDNPTHMSQRPNPKACGIKMHVTLLESRVTVLENLVKPPPDPKVEEEKALLEKLRKFWCLLKDRLKADRYYDYLFQEGALQMADLQNIKSKHSIEEQTDEMLMRLFQQKSTGWVRPFLEKLQEENPHVYKRI